MKEIIKSDEFDQWLRGLRDRRAVARVLARIDRMAMGNPGDVKPVGSGITEMRIDYGPGYRIYYINRGPVIIVLLCGGNKSSQKRDIEKAIELAADWVEDRP